LITGRLFNHHDFNSKKTFLSNPPPLSGIYRIHMRVMDFSRMKRKVHIQNSPIVSHVIVLSQKKNKNNITFMLNHH
jgi:hypothetical protein